MKAIDNPNSNPNNITRKEIRNFLNDFCTPCDATTVESTDVWVDNHRGIRIDMVDYYMPENSVLYSERDEEICSFLNENYHI